MDFISIPMVLLRPKKETLPAMGPGALTPTMEKLSFGCLSPTPTFSMNYLMIGI